jgi:hypothetical protein
MKPSHLLSCGMLALISSSQAMGGVFTDDLKRCAINSASADDRATLGRWIFIVAGANPAFSDLTSISDAERQQSFATTARLFERILLRDCRRESVAAMRNEGAVALGNAFEALGNVAGRQMVSSPESQAMSEVVSGLMDPSGLETLRREAGVPNPARQNTP